MSTLGYGDAEYTRLFFEKINRDFDEFRRTQFKMNEANHVAYKRLFEKLVDYHEGRYTPKNPDEIGDMIENIAVLLFSSLTFFRVSENVKISTNEIDEFVTLTDAGRIAYERGLLNIPSDVILCECKNYKGITKTVSSEQINKLHSVLVTLNIHFGIIFSFNPLSGANRAAGWEDASGLVRKIYLSTSLEIAGNKPMYIICINRLHLNDIYHRNTSFIDIVAAEVDMLKYQKKSISASNATYPPDIVLQLQNTNK